MNLYSKMKNLENKYIDLANFYKQELVKTSKKNTIEESDRDRGSLSTGGYKGLHQAPRHDFSPTRSFERSPRVPHHIDQSVSYELFECV